MVPGTTDEEPGTANRLPATVHGTRKAIGTAIVQRIWTAIRRAMGSVTDGTTERATVRATGKATRKAIRYAIIRAIETAIGRIAESATGKAIEDATGTATMRATLPAIQTAIQQATHTAILPAAWRAALPAGLQELSLKPKASSHKQIDPKSRLAGLYPIKGMMAVILWVAALVTTWLCES